MTARTCPNWPELMELDPDLQFKHYTVAEAQLPAEALARMSQVSLGDVEICCDIDHHVFNPRTPTPRYARRSARRTGSTSTSGRPRPRRQRLHERRLGASGFAAAPDGACGRH